MFGWRPGENESCRWIDPIWLEYWEWPGVLLTGEFHVWVNPAGNLIDITPKPHGEVQILFVPDPNYPENFDFDKRPLNRRQRLYEIADPTAEIAGHIARMRSAQLAYEKKRAAAAGVTLEQSLRNKIPRDPFSQLVVDFISACDKFDEARDAAPGTGYVRVTRQLEAAHQEKMRLLSRIKSKRR